MEPLNGMHVSSRNMLSSSLELSSSFEYSSFSPPTTSLPTSPHYHSPHFPNPSWLPRKRPLKPTTTFSSVNDLTKLALSRPHPSIILHYPAKHLCIPTRESPPWLGYPLQSHPSKEEEHWSLNLGLHAVAGQWQHRCLALSTHLCA